MLIFTDTGLVYCSSPFDVPWAYTWLDPWNL